MIVLRMNFFLVIFLSVESRYSFALNLGKPWQPRSNLQPSTSRQETKIAVVPKLDYKTATDADDSSNSSLNSMLSTASTRNLSPMTSPALPSNNSLVSNKRANSAIFASAILGAVICISALTNYQPSHSSFNHASQANQVVISPNTAKIMARLENNLLKEEPTKQELLQRRIEERATFVEKLDAQPAWVAYCAAMFASFGSTLVVHPIDTIKVEIQRKRKKGHDFDYSMMDLEEVVANQADGEELVQSSLHFDTASDVNNHSLQDETTGISFTPDGIAKLYTGISANLLKEGPPSALYLGLFETIKQYLLVPPDGSQPIFSPLVVYLIAGALGEVAGSIVRAPSEAAKTRMQSGLADNPTEAFQQVILKPKSTFNTWIFSVFRDVPFGAMEIALFEGFRTALLSSGWDMIDVNSIFGEAILGGLAGGISAYVTTPGDVVVTRLITQQSKGKNGDDQESVSSPLEIIKEIYAEGGVPMFFKGSITRILYWTPAIAIFLSLYCQFRALGLQYVH